jgi:hypothetical protein
MRAVGQLFKWLLVIGALAGVGWFVYMQMNKPATTPEGVKEIAQAIAKIVGDEKTELTSVDKPSVEFQVGKLNGVKLETIRDGLKLLDPYASRAQYVAAEIVLRRIYTSVPDGYVSRIDGEPWDVSGDISQMGVFEIDRTTGDEDKVTEMVDAFGPSVTPRATWAK